jgi:ABC-type Zn uptake system ZnuABC Zn-binding protein ZnuA
MERDSEEVGGMGDLLEAIDGRFEKWDDKLEKRFKAQDEKFEKRFDKIDDRFDKIEEKFEKRFDKLDNRLWAFMFVVVATALAAFVKALEAGAISV